MSNMTQLFDASRFQGHVKVQSAGKAAVMTLCGPETGSLRLFSLWDVQFFLSTGSIPRSGLWPRQRRPISFC